MLAIRTETIRDLQHKHKQMQQRMIKAVDQYPVTENRRQPNIREM
jgi:hypothetical protein